MRFLISRSFISGLAVYIFVTCLPILGPFAEANPLDVPCGRIVEVAKPTSTIEKMSPLEQIDEYRRQLGEKVSENESENEKTSRVVTSYEVFKRRLLQLIGPGQFNVIEIVGYSGAGYENLDAYKASVRAQIVAATHNFKGPLVLILGASKGGIGAAYEVAEQMKSNHNLRQLIAVGMISNRIMKYQLEGRAEGRGDTISPNQDLILALKTNPESWELKEAPDGTSRTVDILLDLADRSNCERSELVAYEGGRQAFREIMEFAARADAISGKNKLALTLFQGFEPSAAQAAKGKDYGFRAATQAESPLHDHHFGIKRITVVRLAVGHHEK